MNTAVVIGVGPERGLGAQLCRRFARLGLKVLVAGRTRESLDAVVAQYRGRRGAPRPPSSPMRRTSARSRICSMRPAMS